LRNLLEPLAGNDRVVTLFVYDAADDVFDLPVGLGLFDEQTLVDPGMRPRAGRIAGRIAKACKPFQAPAVRGNPEWDGSFAQRERIVSAYGVPVMRGETAVGVIFVSYREAHEFSADERELIRLTADSAAEEIVGSDLLPVLRASRPLGAPDDQKTLEALVRLVCDVTHTSAAIWLLDRKDRTLKIQAHWVSRRGT